MPRRLLKRFGLYADTRSNRPTELRRSVNGDSERVALVVLVEEQPPPARSNQTQPRAPALRRGRSLERLQPVIQRVVVTAPVDPLQHRKRVVRIGDVEPIRRLT